MGGYVVAAAFGLLWGAWSLDRLRRGAHALRPDGAGARLGGDERSGAAVPNAVLFGAVLGVVLGAKLGFVFAEGYAAFHLPFGKALPTLMQGKTVTGGLLGGYAGVEMAKWWVGHRTATGDVFALVIPGTLIFGRIGCLAAGCCLGVPMEPAWYTAIDPHAASRWPAVPVEIVFNILFLGWAWGHGRHNVKLRGQLFHLYLIAYGLFRVAHESMRATPRMWDLFSGYQLLALAMVALGSWRFVQRQRLAVTLR